MRRVRSEVFRVGVDRLMGKKESQGKNWDGFHFTPQALGTTQGEGTGRKSEMKEECVTIL